MMDYDASCEYWRKLTPEQGKHIRWKFFGETTPHMWDTGPFEKYDTIPLLDGGYIALMDHMGTDIDIVNAARISFNDESTVMDDRDKKLVRYLWKNRHSSPFEMVEFKFVVNCPLFTARQWQRHRTWSYNETSRRYTSEDIDFYIPHTEWIREQAETNRQGSVESEDGFSLMEYFRINAVTDMALDSYHALLDAGVCREQARMVLPQNMYVKFIAKVDLSNLLKFLSLRFDGHAQWEIQQYGEAILELIDPIVPETIKIFREELDA